MGTSFLFVLFCAILPAFLLIAFIRYKDRQHPEPLSWILKGLWYGVLSICVSLLLSQLLAVFRPHLFDQVPFFSGVMTAFYDAALPEESAKLIMLWLLLRHNPYFDERFDGIVYAVCIGMGFAGVENVQYLFESGDQLIGTAISRGIFAVPGHYAFAVVMGFFYSLVHFDKKRYGKYKLLIWLAPFFLHGVYDTLCFAMEQLPGIANLIAFALYFFCYKLHKRCLNHIRFLAQADQNEQDIKTFTEAMKRSN